MDSVSLAESAALVDPHGFEAWADNHLPQLGDGSLRLRYLTGGSTNAVFLITRGGETAVLRRPPRVPRPDSEKILAREARVLGALTGSDVPAPALCAWCADQQPIGTSFYVMAYVDGWTPSGNGPFPPPFNVAGTDRRALAFELFDGIAALARVDHVAAGLKDFGKPGNFLARQVTRWKGQLAMYRETESYAGRVLPGLDYVADWLEANTPETPRLGIIHGDYGFANTLFDRRAPAKLAAMIDWELSTIGDPLLDLGWTAYAFNPRTGVAPPPNIFDASFYPYREELVEFYGDRAGLPVYNIDYYMILAQFKLATLLERKYAESLIGRTSRKSGEYFGQLTLDLVAAAEHMARRSRL